MEHTTKTVVLRARILPLLTPPRVDSWPTPTVFDTVTVVIGRIIGN
jgi:hypothetical protein